MKTKLERLLSFISFSSGLLAVVALASCAFPFHDLLKLAKGMVV